jgi:carboxylesterase type B
MLPVAIALLLSAHMPVQGSIAGPLYDCRRVANESNMVFVTLQYRLGVIGALVGSGDSASDFTGNYNIMDQVAALKWVQQNIAAFGGNPNQVTLFGQSAGAVSTAVHMISPGSRGLFHRAIVESDPFAIPLKSVDDMRRLSALFSTFLGCSLSDTACIMNKTTDELLAAQKKAESVPVDPHLVIELFLQWTPVIDGTIVPQQPLAAVTSGQYAQVPVMIGTVSEEAVLFLYEVFSSPPSEVETVAFIGAVFGPEAAYTVLKRYPIPNPQGDLRVYLSSLATGFTFACATRNATRFMAQRNTAPIYHYVFDHPLSFDGWGPNYTFCVNHTCHGAELPFIFNVPYLAGFAFTADETVLGNTMMAAWTNFGHSGSPNQGPLSLPIVRHPPASSSSSITGASVASL